MHPISGGSCGSASVGRFHSFRFELLQIDHGTHSSSSRPYRWDRRMPCPPTSKVGIELLTLIYAQISLLCHSLLFHQFYACFLHDLLQNPPIIDAIIRKALPGIGNSRPIGVEEDAFGSNGASPLQRICYSCYDVSNMVFWSDVEQLVRSLYKRTTALQI